MNDTYSPFLIRDWWLLFSRLHNPLQKFDNAFAIVYNSQWTGQNNYTVQLVNRYLLVFLFFNIVQLNLNVIFLLAELKFKSIILKK